MTKLSDNRESFKNLYTPFNEAIKRQLLLTGIELNIFDHLRVFSSADEICKKLLSDEKNTLVFLNTLATADYIEKKDGKFKNLKVTDKFLVSTSKEYIGDLLIVSDKMSVVPLANLTSMVKNGYKQKKKELEDENHWAEMSRSSAAWVSSGFGNIIAEKISKLKGFNNIEKIMDLGGGHGLFGIYMSDLNKKIKAYIFDQKEVVAAAEYFIEKYEKRDQVFTIPGNYMEDDIKGPYDLVFASCTFHFHKSSLNNLFSKIYNNLNPGGYLVSLHEGTENENTKPDTLLGRLNAALVSEDNYSFEKGEIKKQMQNLGFKTLDSQTIETPMGDLYLDIGLKE